MKKILFQTLVLAFMIFSDSFAQYGWFQLNSGTALNLNCIFMNGYSGWAVGNSGIIVRTTNDGSNWAPQPSGTSNNLKAVLFSPFTLVGYIAGGNGTILRSGNLGQSWNSVNSGINVDLNGIWALFDSMTVFAVGNAGTILKSTDQGLTWAQKTCPVTNNLRSIISAFPLEIFAVGEGGKILHSFDMGESWYEQASGTSNNINSLSVINNWNFTAIVTAVGDNGTILKTTDSGINWIPITSGTSENLRSNSSNAIWSTNIDTINYFIATGTNGIIIESIGGDYWTNQNSPFSVNLNNIKMQDMNTGFAVGDNGTIIKNISNHFYISRKKMDANSVSTWFSNDGGFNQNKDEMQAGFEWPKGSGKHARYASGFWIGAIVGPDTLVTTAQYNNEYYPGYTDINGVSHGRNDSNYRLYRLTYGVNDNERQRWPNSLLGNSNQGAPVFFDTLSNSWKPLDFGSQTMFYSFTDSYPESHSNWLGGGTLPLKADVKQLNFSLDVGGALGNTVFSQFTIINRSSSVWNNVYLTIWTDDDLGDGYDDKVGCDSALSLGFTYNSDNVDPIYGTSPPAVGFLLLKGALTYTGNSNDTAFLCNNKTRTHVTKYRDNGMKVFNFNINGHPLYHDPEDYAEAYRLMKGLYLDGSSIIHPNGYITTLTFSGNPVTGSGWNAGVTNDYRFYISSGPVNMNPGDTQVIVTAQVIAQGNTNLNSITVMKGYVNAVREFYNSCYTSVPIGIINFGEKGYKFKLEQNYPNPFNPKTKISFRIQELTDVKLVVYDILGREITVLLNKKLSPGTYQADWDGKNFPSGVYFYKLTAGDYSEAKKMVLIK